MRTVFFGTPEIALPALRALADTTNVVAVVCQPDRPSGRGLEVAEPAVKRASRELGLEVHQPVKVKTGNLDAFLRDRDTDVAVVLAYGRILPKAVLDAPKHGCLNLHASLLPRYRGAAPIQWSIIRGETETGLSLMQMDEGLDTGPVFTERKVAILPEDDAGTLSDKLAALAAVVVREDVPRAVRGELRAAPQDEALATLAPPLGRDHGRIDFTRPAHDVVNLVRGLSPRPSAWTLLPATEAGRPGKTIKILAARVVPASGKPAAPGTVIRADKSALWIAADGSVVDVLRAQIEGRKPTTGVDLVNGRAVRLGDLLGGPLVYPSRS